ncbi:MAG: hypothetical protein LBM17_05750 [Candidatus Accumulibacter sp.]|nr:hypothetical protein [Accumulibacter sp.]
MRALHTQHGPRTRPGTQAQLMPIDLRVREKIIRLASIVPFDEKNALAVVAPARLSIEHHLGRGARRETRLGKKLVQRPRLPESGLDVPPVGYPVALPELILANAYRIGFMSAPGNGKRGFRLRGQGGGAAEIQREQQDGARDGGSGEGEWTGERHGELFCRMARVEV